MNYYIAFLLALGVAAIAYIAYFFSNPKDGVHENGNFDDDTEGVGMKPKNILTKQPTYKEVIAIDPNYKLRYFKISEFDSPDEKGSGQNMRVSTLQMLDTARGFAGIPFKVNSGYRTQAHNKKVGGVTNSSHTKGYACDIHAPTREIQQKVIEACRKAGFNRFGIYGTFIHVDNDVTKDLGVAWVKSGGDASLNPFKNSDIA